MSLALALDLSLRLLSWALLISGLEMYWISRQPGFQRIWSFENLKKELESGFPLPEKFLEFLFRLQTFKIIVALEILLALVGLTLSPLTLAWGLFLTHLLICFRFRGTFNGGSDMMIFVLLMGFGIASFGVEEKFQKLGLIYIAIHTLYSYFKAGLVKIRQEDWRRGHALPHFLARSLRPEVRNLSKWFFKKPRLSHALCLSVIVFELGSLMLLLAPSFALTYGALALTFHFLNYVFFGLNRFFWAWLAAWPAVLYSLSLLGV